MKAPDIKQLNKDFSFQDGGHTLQFKNGKGDIPVIEIKNAQASATISLQGAQILSWVPAGEDEVIWVSEDAKFAPGKSVRGGVPICWPWFGAHAANAGFPAHGFARTVLWQVINAKPLSAGETRITFKLDPQQLDENIRQMWPPATVAEFCITVANNLTMELTTFNNSNQNIVIGQALHTYFSIDDISATRVYGLEGRDYLDKTDGFVRKTQTGPVTIESEVDRIYLQTPDDTIIDDSKRKILIKKQGSQSTVVWNPWIEVATKMGDLGKDGYRKMLCVESANASEDVVNINAGENYTLRVIYQII